MSKKYNKEQIEQWLGEFGQRREAGWTLKEIENYFSANWGLQDISFIRKRYSMSKDLNKINIIQDEKSLENIVKAKADLLVNRKINILMNKDLHKQANDDARWAIIKQKLNNWIPESFKIKGTNYDWVEDYKDVIYVVGDIHYRGKQDDQLVINTFSQIKNEIAERGYHDVTLVLTGDNVDGEIHNEQQRTNEPVIDATMRLVNLYVDLINQIPNISKVYMVYGNHEEIRLWGDKGTTNNVGKFIYWGLKSCLIFADVEAGNELLFNYKNKKVLLLHGHQNYAKTKARLIEHCATTYNIQPDYIILGHFHSSKANQFSKNHWLITAPAVKNFESRWDLDNGYCGLGQYIKLKLNFSTPQITTINVEVN